MKRRKLAISVALLAGTIMSSAVPAHAAATPVSGTKTTFDKYLVMKKNANVPNATFSYTVSVPTDDDMDDSFGERVFMNPEDTNNTNLTVKKGIGSPTASSTTFAAGDQTFDEPQKTRTSGSSKTYDEKDLDRVNLRDDKKYAKHASTVDFTNVKFYEPGVYRYRVTENNTSEKGIIKDNHHKYMLDVYVNSDDSGKLSIGGYVFHATNERQEKGDKNNPGANNPGNKNQGIENEYKTGDLVLTKTVKGNQGFRDQYFKFHVDITNLDGNSRLFLTDVNGNRNAYKSADTVAYSYNETSGKRENTQKRFVPTVGTIADITKVKADVDNVTPDSNATVEKEGDADAKGLSITADKDGHAAFDVYLKHNESLKVNGLTNNAKYQITETSEDYNASASKYTDYNHEAIIMSRIFPLSLLVTNVNAERLQTETLPLELTHDKVSHTDTTKAITFSTKDDGNIFTGGNEDSIDFVNFTNSREGVLPTGIYHNNKAMINIIGIAAAGGAIAIVIKKRRKKEKN